MTALAAADRLFLVELARRRAGLAIEPRQDYLIECRLRAVATRHALPSVIAACLLLAVSLPLAGPASAARPSKGHRPHQEGSPSPAPSGPPASIVVSAIMTSLNPACVMLSISSR